MESNGDYDELVQELKSLNDSKRDIEARISLIQAKLNNRNNKVNETNEEHGLSADSIYRYSRQLLLPSFGVQAQSNLLKSSILVIGAGGLGSPALLYLAACGVGKLGMVDHDVVELNNLHRQPLVFGAALGLEGHLAVYNYKGGPCYRCLFPTPPPTTACQRCSDSGVLCRIRIVKIRGRSSQCEACGENATLTQDNFKQFDYENFTQSPLSAAPLKLKLLTPDSRISSKEYNEVVKQGEPHVLIDVRPSHHYKIVSLPKSMNVPLASLEGRLPEISSALNSVKESFRDGSDARLYVITSGVVKSEKSERLSEEAKRSALKRFDSKEARLGLTTIQASASGVNEPRHYTRRNASAFTGRTSKSRTLYDESNQDLVDEDDIVDLGNDDDYSD
ncbi:adenylyltransferase and sulfurtransferase [Tanacetum coccineum]